MTLNPELRRNFWLELTPHRLIAMPVALGLIYLLTLLATAGEPRALAIAGTVTFFVLALLWGCRRAAAGVAAEVRAGTWDWQRMSALGPWPMTWGKLLGGTSFAWYGAAISLVTVAIGLWEVEPPVLVLLELAKLVCAGLLGQAVALAAALAWLRKDRRRVPVSQFQFLGIAVGWLIVSPSLGSFFRSWLGDGAPISADVPWYGLQFHSDHFLLASSAALLAWALLGAYRLMQAELQVRIRPWAWLAFTLFAMVYANGWYLCDGWQGAALLDWLVVPYAVAALSLYAALYLEPKGIVRSRALAAAVRAGDWQRAGVAAPSWLPAVLLLVIMGVVVCVAGIAGDGGSVIGDVFSARQSHLMVPIVLGHFGFVLRDLCLVLALNFGGRPMRADLAASIYLAILYLLLPGIAAAADLDWAAALFWPGMTDWTWLNLAAGWLQAAAAAVLLARRWQGIGRRFVTPSGPRAAAET